MIPAAVTLGLLLTWVLAPPRRPSAGPARPARTRRAPAAALDMARLVEQLSSVIASGASIRQGWAALERTLPEGDLRDLSRASASGADVRRAAGGRLQGTPTVASIGAALAE